MADGSHSRASATTRISALGPATKDAHGVYEKFGFIKLHRPERWMERPDPNMKESPDYWQQVRYARLRRASV